MFALWIKKECFIKTKEESTQKTTSNNMLERGQWGKEMKQYFESPETVEINKENASL